jgi:hypothetical protein
MDDPDFFWISFAFNDPSSSRTKETARYTMHTKEHENVRSGLRIHLRHLRGKHFVQTSLSPCKPVDFLFNTWNYRGLIN